jgi:polar amino acid transport system substrate-binding protein
MKASQIIILALVGLIAIGVCVIAGVLLLRSPDAEATPTAVAEMTEAPVAPSDTPDAGAVDGSWDRIQAAGKMVVGTAADYPPFESYVAPGQIDGFDIALMDEIGRRLGIAIEYRDIAFDGLNPALSNGEIDAAIAAISRTPEREAVLDFSNVYLVAEDGVLAREDSGITIGSTDDLAAYKVGVQRDTVYQEWFQSTLVDSGRMSPDNLFAYEKAEDAIRDLRDGRVQLVSMDAQAAQAFVDQGGVKLVAKGRGQQNYAIALPKGADALKAKLDEIITGLYNDGTVATLSQRYLGVAQVLPTPTPAPTSTPGPQPSCSDGLVLVQHLTQDGQMKPGQTFTKGWQVRNTGTCTWDTSYRLDFASGQKMGGQPVAVSRQVTPGETYDIQIQLVAPLKAGDHQGLWQMRNGKDQAFGERLKVTVKTVPGPTPTPAPTQTPVVGISFTVDRTNIKAGECVNFSWNVQNVKEVYFYAEGERWQDHGVAGQGSQRECPPVNTTYDLRVVKRDNTVDIQKITIYVEASTEAPNISRFTVDPANQITLGQCVTVRWTVEGSLDKVTLSFGGNALWEGAPAKGNTQHCPQAAGSTNYSLEATAPGGATSRAQHNINIVEAATATPAPTAAPEQPVIYTFSVAPNQIAEGDCVDINWSAGGGASYIRVLRDGAAVVDNGPLTGHGTDCPAPAGTYTYRLEAFNPTGQSVAQQQTVTVSAGAPQNPLASTRWQATQINGEPVLAGTSVNIAFYDGGGVEGLAGCNSYSSAYSPDGSNLWIAPPAATGKLCADPAGIMEQETAFLSALASANSFSLEAGQLFINNAGGVLEFVAVGP